MKLKIIIFLFITILIFYSTAYLINAQELKTEILNTENGLSNHKALYIFQDSYELFWIVTGAGVSKCLRHKNKFSLLKMNIIRLLLTDQEIFG